MPRNQPTDRINRVKTLIIPILREFGVKRASLFGSAVRGDFTRASDIDLLVEFPAGTTLLDLVRLENELKEKLRRKVDLLTYDSIHPLLKQPIMAEQVPIYP